MSIEVIINAADTEKKIRVQVICILYMTPLPAIREMSPQSILHCDTSIWTCNKYTLNSRNLQLQSRNGRENTGNFPSLDFPCDMNNNTSSSRPSDTQTSTKTIEKAILAIKLHLVVIPFETKLKSSCLLLSSCRN